MPECAPVSTHPGQEGLREAGSGAKTGLEEPHGQRSPVTCLALDAKRALCSPSLVQQTLGGTQTRGTLHVGAADTGSHERIGQVSIREVGTTKVGTV